MKTVKSLISPHVAGSHPEIQNKSDSGDFGMFYLEKRKKDHSILRTVNLSNEFAEKYFRTDCLAEYSSPRKHHFLSGDF